VTQKRLALFRGRHFEDVVIIFCVRWYLRYSLGYRDLEEIMAERNLAVDQVTIWRWVQRYAPILNQRLRRELRLPGPEQSESSAVPRNDSFRLDDAQG
jgi:IS6 family transposase